MSEAEVLAAAREPKDRRAQYAAYRAAHREERLAYQAIYRKEHQAEKSAYNREWALAHPDKVAEHGQRAYERAKRLGIHNAGHALRRAVKSGRVTRQPCMKCGEPKVQAHHYLGYAPEHRLDVVWLCRIHHAAAHYGKTND